MHSFLGGPTFAFGRAFAFGSAAASPPSMAAHFKDARLDEKEDRFFRLSTDVVRDLHFFLQIGIEKRSRKNEKKKIVRTMRTWY